MTGRVLRAGLLLAGLYVLAVAATALTTGQTVRPLFDGIGGSTPYKWVRAPWYVGSTNIKPGPSSTDIPFENGTSPLIGVNSEDAQIILNLPQGAVCRPARGTRPYGRRSPPSTRRSWPNRPGGCAPTAMPIGWT